MSKTKTGKLLYWRYSASALAIFRLTPEIGSKFPRYSAGQYIALQRNDCRMTQKVVTEGGNVEYVSILDEQGNPKRGAVTHSYSIASAPFETDQKGYLEFYVVLEVDEKGERGRLTESIFRMRLDGDNNMTYYDKIAGDFTLDKRAAGFENVIMVGTGTGVAPFVSMLKQLDFESASVKDKSVRYTLLHTNRTYEELDYLQDLLAIEAAQKIDFVYIPSVSRPTPSDWNNPALGRGRANNVLRYLLDLPLKEEQDLEEITARSGDIATAQAIVDRTTRPALPKHLSREALRDHMDPARTVVLACGNPWSMEDIKYAAHARGMRFEKEDW